MSASATSTGIPNVVFVLLVFGGEEYVYFGHPVSLPQCYLRLSSCKPTTAVPLYILMYTIQYSS
jgi:hypothetical protein